MEFARLLVPALLLATASCSDDAGFNQPTSDNLGLGRLPATMSDQTH
jgi:hypothetical protein